MAGVLGRHVSAGEQISFFLANVFKNEFSFLLRKCIVHQLGDIEIYLRDDLEDF